jgi:hypothetical protein
MVAMLSAIKEGLALTPRRFLILISFRATVNPKSMVWLE